jgi:hypothetical protein
LTTIYLIECINEYDEPLYKIGHTKNNPLKRLQQLQTGNAHKLKMVGEYSTRYGTKLEKTLHRHFSHLNINNEWFKLTFDEVVDFKKTCENIERGFKILEETNNYFFDKI